MKKIMIIIGMMITSLALVGCQDDPEAVTAPTFAGFTVDGTNPTEGGSLTTFYKEKQASTVISIQIQNPDSVQIKSIKINGYDYHSARFTEDSTDTVKTFIMSAGSTLGSTTYSIDEITYMDGDTEKSIRNFTSNEFELYVYKDLPTVERENYSLEQDTISVDLDITDPDNVIMSGTLIAALYLGDQMISEQAMSKGLSNATFTNLQSNRQYEVKVHASYDLDDNNGLQANVVLFSGTFETIAKGLPNASIQNVQIDSNEISFDVFIDDEDNVMIPGGLSAVVVNADNEIVEQVSLAESTFGIVFDELLNDANYTIKILADYDLEDGAGIIYDQMIGSRTFETLPQSVPVPQIENLEVAENVINFNITLNENQDVIILDTMYANLYFEGELVNTVNLAGTYVGFQVLNVFANYEFTIEIIGDYDLNDGSGIFEDQVLYSETFSTLEKTAPSLSVTSTTIDQETVVLSLGVQDPDDTLFGAIEARLYENDTLIDTLLFNEDDTTITFNYPTKYSETYYIEIIGDYDLSDGSPFVEEFIFYRGVLITGQKKTPVVEFDDLSSEDDSISLSVDVIDSDQTIIEDTLFLDVYNNYQLITSLPLDIGDNDIVLTNLQSDQNYSINVRVSYQLEDDGSIYANEYIGEIGFKTETNTVPEAVILLGEEDISHNRLDVILELIDEDSTIVGNDYVEVYQGDNLLLTKQLNIGSTEFTVSGLLPNTEYTFIVKADYDLNDGEGVQTNKTIHTFKQRTSAVEVISIAGEAIDKTSNTLEITIDDPEDIITSEFITATVYEGARVFNTYAIGSNLTASLDLRNLLSNFEYTIEFSGTYSTGDGDVTEVLFTHTFTTDAVDLPSVTIDALTEDDFNSSSLDFRVTVGADETNSANDDGWVAILYQDGVFVEEIELDDDIEGGDVVEERFDDYDPELGSSITILIRALVDSNTSRELNEVVTDMAAMTYMDTTLPEPEEE
jgi:hypothetical protein